MRVLLIDAVHRCQRDRGSPDQNGARRNVDEEDGLRAT
jgi:hypothetical protein